MSIESLSKDINSQVEEKKNQISQQYEEELEQFQQELDEEINQYKNYLYKIYSNDFSKKKSSIIGSATSKAKSNILENKKNYQIDLKEKSISKLKEIDEKTKKQTYNIMLKSLDKEFSYSRIEISSNDYNIISSLVKKNIEIIKKNKMIGGIKAYSEDNRYSIDLSFETIIEEVFEE